MSRNSNLTSLESKDEKDSKAFVKNELSPKNVEPAVYLESEAEVNTKTG
jgi:hypothetical protein